VDFCQGKQTTFYINQAAGGGQWNEIGSLPFFTGIEGKLTMRNSLDEQCSAANCFWVADAFRLTWTGPNCAAAAPAREGVVTLSAQAGDGLDHTDLHQELEANMKVLELTLEAYLGYSTVKVQSILFAGRRLHDIHETLGFKARFSASGTSSDTGGGNLMQKLQSAFNAAGARVTLEAADVHWEIQPVPQASRVKSTNICLYVVLGFAMTGVILGVVCGLLFLRRRWQARAANAVKVTKNNEAVDAVDAVDLEGESVKSRTVDEKNEGPWEIQSVSTGTPSSEEGARSDGTNEGCRPEAQGNEMNKDNTDHTVNETETV
jgi:hypothetical protein